MHRSFLLAALPFLLLFTGCISTKIEAGDVPIETLTLEGRYYGSEYLHGRTYAQEDGSLLFLRRKQNRDFALERYRPGFTVDMQAPFEAAKKEALTRLVRNGNNYSILSIDVDDDFWKVYARRVDMAGESIGEPQLLYASTEEMEAGVYITFSPDSSKILLYSFGEVNRRGGDREKSIYSRPLEGVILNSSLQVVDSFRIAAPYPILKDEIILVQPFPSNDGKLLLFHVKYNDPGYIVSCLTYSAAGVSTLEQEIPMTEEGVKKSTPKGLHILSDGDSKFESLVHLRTGDHLTGLVRVQWDFAKGTVTQHRILTATKELAEKLVDDNEFEDFWIWNTKLLKDGSLFVGLSDYSIVEGSSTDSKGRTRYYSYTKAKKSLILYFDNKNALSQSVLIDRDEMGRSADVGRMEGPFTPMIEGRTLHLLMHKQEYLETRRPMGVFRVLNTANGKSFVGTSADLPAMLNRQKAQLQLKGHPNTALQNDWNTFGPDAFQFEVLDTLNPPERLDYKPENDLRALEELWLEKLAPYGDAGYNREMKK